MAGRTKLYQQAKSPLIQGLSKHERPSWQPWLGGTVFGAGSAVVVLIAISYLGSSQLPGWRTVALWAALAACGSALGAVIWVWLGRRMGWRRLSVGSTLLGAVLGLAAAYGGSVWLASLF